MESIITQRLNEMREVLRKNNLDAYIFTSTDPHNSEYPPEYWKTREWASGFNGSAGTAVVTLHEAALWTDSRYFIAAAEQLAGTTYTLMKDKLPTTPSIDEWLGCVLPAGAKVGIDCTSNSYTLVNELSGKLSDKNISVCHSENPADSLWTSRPALPTAPIELHPIEMAGEEATHKIARTRKAIQDAGADALVITALDEVAWTLNLRGTDAHRTPVFLAYLIILPHTSLLYTLPGKITPEVKLYLASIGVEVRDYNKVFSDCESWACSIIALPLNSTNHQMVSQCMTHHSIKNMDSPIAMMKAVKNATEIKGLHAAMLRDGVAMVKFLKWLEESIGKEPLSELSVSDKLEAFRAQGEYYRDLSFDTIAGYGAHAAIVHYEPTAETDIPLLPKGLLLLDSGAQYTDGTTDITRTIALGPTTPEERHDYTLVLKGHIMLARLRFPSGSSGTQLDVCARYAMWQEGKNYLHGTGHGVGSYLSVHEGPHQFRMNYMPAPFLEGMTVTNEPGLYIEGSHGARTENTMLITHFCESEYGDFLQFEPLTLCPIDTKPIDFSMLDTTEIEWLNNYHQMVYDKLAPILDKSHRAWLAQATIPLGLHNK